MAAETILVVDDDKVTRKLVSGVLERHGYRVQTANDGLEALGMVAEAAPDLVITDVLMPHVNGLELTQRLRRTHRTARIPVVMLSVRSRNEEILAGYAEGADEYVHKPVDMEVLVAKVGALLQRTRAAARAEQPAALGTVHVFLRGKGGVGTTMIAVNAAAALAASGADRVVLLDLNLGFGNAAMLLDLQPQRTLAATRDVSIAELDDDVFARLAVRHEGGVRVIVGSDTPETAELVSVSAVQATIDRLRTQFDFILIDLPVGFSEVNLAAIDTAHAVYLITTPHVTSVRATADCQRVLEELKIPAKSVRVILNRTTPNGLDNELVAKTLGRKPDILIPYTAWYENAVNAGRPLITYQPGSPGVMEIESVADSIRALAPVPV
jgi:pilus assembly protein CpaE